MMKTINRIRAADYPKLVRIEGKHNDGGSLYLVVRGGSARWEFQYRRNGKLYSQWFGPATGLAAVSLAEARAARARAWLENRGKVHARVEGKPFSEALEAWLDANVSTWAAKGIAARRGMAEGDTALSLVGKDVAKITQGDVLAALANETPRMRAEKRGYLAAMFSFAKTQGWRAADSDNPARLDKDTLEGLPKVEKTGKHHARVSRDDLPALYASIVDGDTARALRFLILTAARAGDVEGATWSEIHRKGATFTTASGDTETLVCDAWIIPAERTKERQRRMVPLPPQAMAILGELGKPDELLFGKLPANAMLNLLQKTHPDKTVHGMRSTFRDWAIRQNVALEHGATMRDLAELAQGHNLPGASTVERAYARDGLYDLRAPLMEKWALFATGR